MITPFIKYQGTGNDFIMLNAIQNNALLNLSDRQIAFLCNRHFGIGADGLIVLSKHEVHDFEMIYYNADGGLSTMCGNGGRCIIKLAHKLRLFREETSFMAEDGVHKGRIDNDMISLQMRDVNQIIIDDGGVVLDTGSPHFVRFISNNEQVDIVQFGRTIRYSDKFKKEGINVNVAQNKNGVLHIETYERGVEDETLSCGTGVTATAIAASLIMPFYAHHRSIDISTKGGELNVSFDLNNEGQYTDIWLSGPAKEVFSGNINI